MLCFWRLTLSLITALTNVKQDGKKVEREMIEKKMAQQTTEDGTVFAIFDLDGTILDGDSDYQWNIYLIEKKIVDGKSYLSKNDFYYQQYLEGKLNIHEYQFLFAVFYQKPFLKRNRKD